MTPIFVFDERLQEIRILREMPLPGAPADVLYTMVLPNKADFDPFYRAMMARRVKTFPQSRKKQPIQRGRGRPAASESAT